MHHVVHVPVHVRIMFDKTAIYFSVQTILMAPTFKGNFLYKYCIADSSTFLSFLGVARNKFM